MNLEFTFETKNEATKIIFDILKSDSKLNDNGDAVIWKERKNSFDSGISDAIFKYTLFSMLYKDNLEDISNWGELVENRDTKECIDIEVFYDDIKKDLIRMGLIKTDFFSKNIIWFTLKGYKYFLDIEKSCKRIELFENIELLEKEENKCISTKVKLKLSKINTVDMKQDVLNIIYSFCGNNKKKILSKKELIIRYLSLLDNKIKKYMHYSDLIKSNLYDLESIKEIEICLNEVILDIYRSNYIVYSYYYEHISITTTGIDLMKSKISIGSNSSHKLSSSMSKYRWYKTPWKMTIFSIIIMIIVGIPSYILLFKPNKDLSTHGNYNPVKIEGDFVGRDQFKGEKINVLINNNPKNDKLIEAKLNVKINRILENTNSFLEEESIKLSKNQKKQINEDSFRNPNGYGSGHFLKNQIQVLQNFIKELDNELIAMHQAIEDTVLSEDVSPKYLDNRWIKERELENITTFQNKVYNEINELQDSKLFKDSPNYINITNQINENIVLKYLAVIR